LAVGDASQRGKDPAEVQDQPSHAFGQTAGDQDDLDALKLKYAYVRAENLRLRDGRAALTRQLGPLPIGAAVVAGLVTGFTGKTHNVGLLIAALVLFGVLVAVSIWYSSMKPYRVLRHEHEAKFPRSATSERDWYKNAIALENALYGEPSKQKGYRRHRPAEINGLQEGYDRERSGLFVVQGLFAAVIVLLIISRIA
jgi:hypothetical protein